MSAALTVVSCSNPAAEVTPPGPPDATSYVPDPTVCSGDDPVAALQVRVVDGRGAPLCDAEVTVTVDGESSSLPAGGPPSCIHAGLADRTGLADIVVTHPACSTSRRDAVAFGDPGCPAHPSTTTLVVALDCQVDGSAPDAGG